MILCFQRKVDLRPHALVYAVVAAGGTALCRCIKLDIFLVVAVFAAVCADDVAALHRLARYSNRPTADASVADGAAGLLLLPRNAFVPRTASNLLLQLLRRYIPDIPSCTLFYSTLGYLLL